MNICVIGSGYVGLVTGTCFAEMGNNVWCVDVDEEKISMLRDGDIPIYETGLKELVQSNLAEGRLRFTTDIKEGLENTLVCFIAVGTPPTEDGSADIYHVLNVAKSIGINMDRHMIIVNKSTVPVGTGARVKDIIKEQLRLRNKEQIEFDVVSNPEFLKEGAAIEDFMRPDRIVIGTDNVRTAELMKKLYEPFTRNNHPVLIMDIKSAEITKYAANAMLATRISFMNELARLCDNVGADIASVRIGIGSDSRIGMPFLYAGTGYGGSCFPKDVKELIQSGRKNGVAMEIIDAVERVNEQQKRYLVEMIINRFGEDLKGKTFALWGLAFKPMTDDMREAPSIIITKELTERGAQIKGYDPVAMEQARRVLAGFKNIEYVAQMQDAVRDVDALILVTEWRQFRQVNFEDIKPLMKTPIVFDGRNQYNPEQMKNQGFEYYCIGRSCNVR